MDPLRGALVGEWKEAYDALEQKYGRQVPDEVLPYLVREAKEYVSPKSAEELGAWGLMKSSPTSNRGNPLKALKGTRSEVWRVRSGPPSLTRPSFFPRRREV